MSQQIDGALGDLIPARDAPVALASRGAKRGRALVMLAFFGLIALYLASLDRDLFARYAWDIAEGLGVTIKIVGTSVLIGGLLALPVAWARLSSSRFIGAPAFGYSYLFRGTPLLAQIFLVYYGAGEFNGLMKQLGVWWILRDPTSCAILVFALNTAAYQGEIYRGAIAAVPKGQWEAGRALGLPSWRIFAQIILPQAAVTALRPLGNEIIFMVKASAIASIITVYDLMGETTLAYSRTYNLEVYLWAAVLYLVFVEALRRLWALAERRLTRHLVR